MPLHRRANSDLSGGVRMDVTMPKTNASAAQGLSPIRKGWSPRIAASASISWVASSVIGCRGCRPIPWPWSRLAFIVRNIDFTIGRAGAGIGPNICRPAFARNYQDRAISACPACREIEVIFAYPLNGPGNRLLLDAQAGVEIEAVFFLEMEADQRGVRDLHSVVLNVRAEPMWAFERISLHFAIWHPGKPEQHHGLDHEGARIRRAEKRSEFVERDHFRSP